MNIKELQKIKKGTVIKDFLLIEDDQSEKETLSDDAKNAKKAVKDKSDPIKSEPKLRTDAWIVEDIQEINVPIDLSEADKNLLQEQAKKMEDEYKEKKKSDKSKKDEDEDEEKQPDEQENTLLEKLLSGQMNQTKPALLVRKLDNNYVYNPTGKIGMVAIDRDTDLKIVKKLKPTYIDVQTLIPLLEECEEDHNVSLHVLTALVRTINPSDSEIHDYVGTQRHNDQDYFNHVESLKQMRDEYSDE